MRTAAPPEPLGIIPTSVVEFAVLVSNKTLLVIVALLKSPVMRWAVLENVRLPPEIVSPLEAESVVNAPVLGVVAPIGGIEAAMFVSVSL